MSPILRSCSLVEHMSRIPLCVEALNALPNWIWLDGSLEAGVVALAGAFSPYFFLPLKFLLMCLDTALCEQLAYLANSFVAFLLVKGADDSSEHVSRQQSSSRLNK